MQITDFRTIADIVISIVVLPLFQGSKAVYTIKKKDGLRNKQDHCYSKREEAASSLLFLNNNDSRVIVVFCTVLFAPCIFELFFIVPDP